MKKNLKITVEIEERWVPYFCSFLKKMEYNGNIGHSALLGFYSDGDGDFRPKFKINKNYEKVDSLTRSSYKTKTEWNSKNNCEEIYDAG